LSQLLQLVPVPVMPGTFSSEYDVDPERPEHGTTHLVTMDSEGNIVTLTTSIEDNFGSGIVVPGRGFFLNNHMTDFSYNAYGSGRAYANGIKGGLAPRRAALGADKLTSGGQRPRSSMSPTIVLRPDGTPVIAIGTPGGSRIIGTVFNALVSMIDSGLSLKDAVDKPRAIGRNGAAWLEDMDQCQCPYPALYSNQELMQELHQRGMATASMATPRPYTYMEGIYVHSNGTVEAYADINRMPTSYARVVHPARHGV